MNRLEQLRQYTTVVADTGDFNALAAYRPQDATTNPSLIYKAVQDPRYATLVEEIRGNQGAESVEDLADQLLVRFGVEILKIVPGRVSTEVDARLSFNVAATVAKAHALLSLYEAQGIGRDRVLIKIASTWEGIEAAEILEREGVHCNMTLLFSEAQAIACADAGVTLISPFVGRITDWHKARDNRGFTAETDPGVQSVRRIFARYRKLGYRTQVMGASFRNTDQIVALSGCDLLTISPALLDALSREDGTFDPALTDEWARTQSIAPEVLDEPSFRWQLNEDAMATDKLSEGIRIFAADARSLESLLQADRLEALKT